jgi:hypothetical protein
MKYTLFIKGTYGGYYGGGCLGWGNLPSTAWYKDISKAITSDKKSMEQLQKYWGGDVVEIPENLSN